jgi:hypothetical protein
MIKVKIVKVTFFVSLFGFMDKYNAVANYGANIKKTAKIW